MKELIGSAVVSSLIIALAVAIGLIGLEVYFRYRLWKLNRPPYSSKANRIPFFISLVMVASIMAGCQSTEQIKLGDGKIGTTGITTEQALGVAIDVSAAAADAYRPGAGKLIKSIRPAKVTSTAELVPGYDVVWDYFNADKVRQTFDGWYREPRLQPKSSAATAPAPFDLSQIVPDLNAPTSSVPVIVTVDGQETVIVDGYEVSMDLINQVNAIASNLAAQAAAEAQ